MRKIVINDCFGGFGMSEKAMMRYAEIKGITLYPVHDTQYPSLGLITYYRVPEGQRTPELKDWPNQPMEVRQAYNEAYSKETIYEREIPRDDPALVQVVEELGKEANDKHSCLKVVEVPDDVKWHIEEYDGNEHVAEDHRTWG